MSETKDTSTIDGVIITPKRKIFDDRGGIFHMLRRDDPEFKEFGEIYFSKVYPNVVKAWHHHSKMDLNYFCVYGSIRLALYDGRNYSPTQGLYQEIVLHEQESKLVTVPHGIWNGFRGLGNTPSLIANCATEPHDPEEITYKPIDDPMFNYSWEQRHG
ncbi:MAG: dTDP-4-dehydrorhamnose 3,5-epimerase [Bdellovibrionaceae bacterium]|nr:dTDP-4-dehydrorhamnose 3,5-epimerase [Pseudobdellovibrionaceae bacterium]|tara:strand:- start:2428 stop:2901 length:474 start_codon:yes stop_codon:yes gene_type:complete